MTMTKRRPKKCKRCGARVDDGATVSKRALCIDCSTSAVAASITDLRTRRGPAYDRWLAGCIGATPAPPTPSLVGTPDEAADDEANASATG